MTAGAEAVEVELDTAGDATGGGVLCDSPHPPPTTKARKRQRIAAPGFQPASQPKSKSTFIQGKYLD